MAFKLLSHQIHGFFNAAIYLIVGWAAVLPIVIAENGADWLPPGSYAPLLWGGFFLHCRIRGLLLAMA